MTDFETRDGGKREEFQTGSRRDTREGKGRFDLVPPLCLRRLAALYERGAVKYGPSNWQKGQPLSRYLDSALRHLNQIAAGDEGEDHAAAVAWNAFGLMWTREMIRAGRLPAELDDLPPPEPEFSRCGCLHAQRHVGPMRPEHNCPCAMDCPCVQDEPYPAFTDAEVGEVAVAAWNACPWNETRQTTSPDTIPPGWSIAARQLIDGDESALWPECLEAAEAKIFEISRRPATPQGGVRHQHDLLGRLDETSEKMVDRACVACTAAQTSHARYRGKVPVTHLPGDACVLKTERGA